MIDYNDKLLSNATLLNFFESNINTKWQMQRRLGIAGLKISGMPPRASGQVN